MKTLLWILVIVVVGAIVLRLLMPKLGSRVAGGVVAAGDEARLADCPGSPNCQGSMSSDPARRVDALPAAGSVGDSMALLESVLAGESGAAVVSRDGNYLHATFTSSLMGYIDDVEFLVDAASSRIDVRSASRVGKSDLGANKKRTDRLRAALSEALEQD